MLPYTIVIVLGIHRYEAKMKRINNNLDILETEFFDLYNEYCIKSPNAQHYTQIQLDNIDLRKTISDLDIANKLLQQQIRQIKEDFLNSRSIQYESSTYQDNKSQPSIFGEDGFLIEL
jgi:hypothetical protein